VEQSIGGYHIDEAGDWVAELECGHFQHVRHDPPWVNRPWVVEERGRASMLGKKLNCTKCDSGEPEDRCPR
jgi:hypothetical protein